MKADDDGDGAAAACCLLLAACCCLLAAADDDDAAVAVIAAAAFVTGARDRLMGSTRVSTAAVASVLLARCDYPPPSPLRRLPCCSCFLERARKNVPL